MITKKQKKVLDYIKGHLEKEGYAPSLEEIQKHFKLASVSTAHYYIKKLQAGGYLNKESNQPRAISFDSHGPIRSPFIDEVGLGSISIPIVGAANCGVPNITAIENIEGYLKVSQSLFDMTEGVFVVLAQGDSMNAANIRGKSIEDGDYVIIDSGYKHPRSGDYVLSIIDGCANLKRFSINERTKQIMLVSESRSPEHKPIFISSEDDFMINGKIIAVIKK